MGRLEVLFAHDPNERAHWLEILHGWGSPPPFCTPAYLELFASPEETPVILSYSSREGDMLLPLCLRVVNSPLALLDAVGPYGYGCAYRRGGQTVSDRFWREVRTWADSVNLVSIVMRLPLEVAVDVEWPFDRIDVMRNVVREIGPWDEMWMDFDHKVRKNYKKAQRSGVDVTISGAEDDAAFADFLSVYLETMARRAASSRFILSEERLNRLRHELAQTCFFALGKVSGEAVAAELVLVEDSNMYSFLGGTRAASFELRPNDYLKCELMRWAGQRGIQRFILGGGMGSEDGIFRYKASFAPHGLVNFAIGEWIVSSHLYDDLVSERHSSSPDWQPTAGFFPRYRA